MTRVTTEDLPKTFAPIGWLQTNEFSDDVLDLNDLNKYFELCSLSTHFPTAYFLQDLSS